MNTNALIELANSNTTASAFFDDLARRERNYKETTVERAMAITRSHRGAVVRMFKHMETLGLGHFINGRRGASSRFEWTVGMVEAARAASGEANIEDMNVADYEIEDGELEVKDGVIEHSFVLRRGEEPITITLPEDLTPLEAERLSRFISALPMA